MEPRPAGFREIEHTADWQLEAWAPDLPGLLEQAARGMYSLAGVRLESEPRCTRSFEIKGQDMESLLVRFLAELLYIADEEGLGFDAYDLNLSASGLAARLAGAHLAERGKEIKAVTYHNLKVQKTTSGLSVRIVFDV
jgi:SHS2 domain-containing protein